jgi:hypothetical protein
MRKVLPITVAAAAIALALLPMTLASAAPAARHAVLTTGKVGGTNVKVGATLVSGLAKGTKATFFEGAKSKSGIVCKSSTLTVKVVKNPFRPGTAIESETKQTFSKCSTQNLTGQEVTGVNSVTVTKTPYKATISDSRGNPTAVYKVSTLLNLKTDLGGIKCAYSDSKVSGSASDSGQVLTVKNQVFKKVSGPTPCPHSGDLSASFGPVIDTSVKGHPHVFLN